MFRFNGNHVAEPVCLHPEGKGYSTPFMEAKLERLGIKPDRPMGEHDCTYVDAINDLIPEAMKLARERCNGGGPGTNWTRVFMETMNELARAKGLRK